LLEHWPNHEPDEAANHKRADKVPAMTAAEKNILSFGEQQSRNSQSNSANGTAFWTTAVYSKPVYSRP
jgi:hypothetical protein